MKCPECQSGPPAVPKGEGLYECIVCVDKPQFTKDGTVVSRIVRVYERIVCGNCACTGIDGTGYEGAGIICFACSGKGWLASPDPGTQFTGRARKEGIERVRHGGLGIDEPTPASILYEQFFEGEMPPPAELGP